MSEQPLSSDEFRRLYGRRPGTIGGPVDDGDSRHAKHSYLVRECGNWLLGKDGVLVWATGTGRWTGKGMKGTAGVPDLVGWRTETARIAVNVENEAFGPDSELQEMFWKPGAFARLVAVECKVLPDALNPAQEHFRDEALKAGAIWIEARWSGEIGDDPVADLKAKWKETQT